MIDTIITLFFDFVAIIAFLWTLIQELRYRKTQPVITDDKLDKLQYLLDKFQEDIKACINEKPKLVESVL